MNKPKTTDAFGAALWDHHHSGHIDEIIESQSGFIWTNKGGMRMYFAPYAKWSRAEQNAIAHAKGAVLDIGCGAGRHSLWLEANGHRVTAVDSSFLATEVAKLRGVKDVRWIPLEHIAELGNETHYDTVLLLGNGLGLFGTISAARKFLRELAKLTTRDGMIIANSVDPGSIDQEVFCGKSARGKFAGYVRIRIRYRHEATAWFDYCYVSFGELQRIIKGTGWVLQTHIKGQGGSYAVILAKK